MKRPAIWCYLLFVCATMLHAGSRSSASYSIITDSADSGGVRTSSAAYTNDGSAGSVTGVGTVTSPAEFAKNGYIGQLYEVTGLALNTSSGSLNETTGTVQLGASQMLDDSSTIALVANTVAWSVQSGPIVSISSGGLATAGTVYQDTAAVVMGSYAGGSGTLNLTVKNVNDDDYGIYAGDGIDDAWQVQYFGVNNTRGLPNVVSDGSGLTNYFKFTAGLIPNNSASTFSISVQPVNGQPGQANIIFSPSLLDRNYTVLTSTDLVSWSTLMGPFAGNGTTSTVTDTATGTAHRFYSVQINFP